MMPVIKHELPASCFFSRSRFPVKNHVFQYSESAGDQNSNSFFGRYRKQSLPQSKGMCSAQDGDHQTGQDHDHADHFVQGAVFLEDEHAQQHADRQTELTEHLDV